MSRHYVLGSWANADEFDYSGEQLMGHRQGKSICMDHMLPSGMANLKRYGDPVTPVSKTPTKPKLTAFDKVCTADRTYSRLCALSEELDNQLENGELDLTDWSFARKQLDVKLDKSWKAVCRLRNWSDSGESLDSYPEHELTFNLEDVQSQQIVEKNKHKTHDLTGWATIDSLSEENVFKGLFCKVKRVMMFIESLNKWEK